jgi:hypothetical protein
MATLTNVSTLDHGRSPEYSEVAHEIREAILAAVRIAARSLPVTRSSRGTGLGIKINASQLVTNASGLPAFELEMVRTAISAASSAIATPHRHSHESRSA